MTVGAPTGPDYLTVVSSSRAPSERVMGTLPSGSERRQESRGRLIGSLTTTCDDGGAVEVTDDLTPGLDATTVPPPTTCAGTSQTEPYWTVPGTTVVVPGAHATGTVP
jgi:hypothetical protein